MWMRRQRFAEILAVLQKISDNNDVASYTDLVATFAIEWGLKESKVAEYLDILSRGNKIRIENLDGTKTVKICIAE